MASWYYYNRYLPRIWKQMRGEQRYEEEAYLRRKAKREGKEYQPPDVRRAEREYEQKRDKLHGFARAYRQYTQNPEAYLDKYKPFTGTVDLDTGEDIAGTWVPFEGPQGGRGWKHTGTGNKKYQLERPGANSRPNEPPNMEGQWRDPGSLDPENSAFERPLSPGEARDFFDR